MCKRISNIYSATILIAYYDRCIANALHGRIRDLCGKNHFRTECKVKKITVLLSMLLLSSFSLANTESDTDGGFEIRTNSAEKIAHLFLIDSTPRIRGFSSNTTNLVFNGMNMTVAGKVTTIRGDIDWLLVKSTMDRILLCRKPHADSKRPAYCWEVDNGEDVITALGG